MPLSFAQEWDACTRDCGIIFLSDRRLIALRGKDKQEFLQGIFSQDVKNNFPEGTVLYGLFPNLKGKIISDAFVSHLSSAFFLDVPESGFSSLLKHLEQYLVLMETEIRDCSQEYQLISLVGPKAQDLIQKTYNVKFSTSQECRKIGEGNTFLFPFQFREFQEYRIWSDKKTSDILQKLEEAGAVPIRKKTYETLQIQSGVPRFGREMDENTFPAEVGLEEYVNFRKGCFLGAEVLQRIFYQGHVNRCLVLFALESPNLSPEEPLRQGCPIQQGNQEIGKITAGTFAFDEKQPMALGLVKTTALESKTSFVTFQEGKTVSLKILRTFPPSPKTLGEK